MSAPTRKRQSLSLTTRRSALHLRMYYRALR
uniref:Uncharacterized protein n=1 Tax=Anguilla anguilla TaxID=7936 RepID=A0A0E9SS85_ANGAN